MKSFLKISLDYNPFHRLDYAVEMVGYTDPEIVEIEKRKKIDERSVKEITGAGFKEFFDSDRYKIIVKRKQLTLVLKVIFYSPWKVSVN